MPTQTTQPQVASAPTPGFARRKARALIGWLTVEEGALWLSGRQMNQTVSDVHRAACEAAKAAVAARPVALARITLPIPSPEQLLAAFDSTKNAWILSSPNPNLRVVGHFNAQVAPGTFGFGFAVALHKSYLQVAGLNGRYFLRDGYHRAFGLLSAGIRFAPALVKEYESFEQVALPQGLLPQDAYLGTRPPFLTDYLDDSVAADTVLPVSLKMVVVQGLELNSLG